MKILITGASGFIGCNLKPYLEQHHQVITQSLKKTFDAKELIQNCDAIIHLAGKAHDTSNTSDADEYFKVNTDLTIRLFNHFLNNDTRDFIYFSSVKAVADTVENILTEEESPKPQTPYGLSKQKAEQYLLSQVLPESKRLFIIRPCMIHGPGNKGNLNLLYSFVAKGVPYPFAAFENSRSFLSIDNLCYIIDGILKNNSISSGIYNVADDETLSTNEVVKIIASTLGKRSLLLAIPKSMLKTVAKLGDMLSLPINSERLKKLTENYIVSNIKIKKALGITSLPVTSTEGLVKTIKSFQAN